MILYPAIDLKDGQCVRVVHGDFSTATVFNEDPADQARIWTDTLGHIDRAGLLDALLYVDFCNEFPIPFWTPYLYGGIEGEEVSRRAPHIVAWMRDSIEIVDVEDVPLAYLPGNATRVRVKAVGELHVA